MKLRHLASLLVVLAATVGLALALPGAAQAQKRGGTLIYMVPASDPPSLDGHQEETFATIQPTAPFYSLLIEVDPRSKGGSKIMGDIATGWKVSKDGKTYTFPMRKGVTFHDGKPLRARDVVASLEHFIFPPEGVISPRKSQFSMVDSIEAKGDYTVVIKLKFPSGAFIPALAAPYNYIYEADILAKDPNWYKKNVMGSGPFKFVSYTTGDKVVGVRNPKFYIKGQPYLDGFEAIFAPKQSVEVQAIRGGRAHSMFRGLPPAARDELTQAMGDKVNVQESTWNCGLFAVLNPFIKPFDDIRVRQAMNLALDRRQGSEFLSKIAIVKTVGTAIFPGTELAPSEAQMETLLGFSKDINASRAKAKELLKEAGVPEGFKITFSNRNTDQPYKFVTTWLIDQWRQIGLDVTQEVLTTPALFEKLRSNPPTFQASIDFNCQSIVNPALDISKFLSADRSDANYAKYTDRKLDELFDAQLREPNKAKQKELLWQFEKRLNEQSYYITTFWWHRIVVSSSKMKWWEVTPSHYLNMQMGSVWLDQ
jgi:peptide/nickel transport system substrate-binding protein